MYIFIVKYKDITMKYKHKDKFPNSTGIYLISFKNTNKVYIGSACSNGRYLYEKGFSPRWKHHLYRLKQGSHEKKIQNAFNKYGIDNLYFQIIDFCEKNNQFEKEQYWINKYDSAKSGYNTLEKAGDWPKTILSKESREKAKKTKENKKTELKSMVLNLYNLGLSNSEIIKKIKISKNTVTKYLKESNIKNKNGFLWRSKKVYCFNIKTKEIVIFNNPIDCSKNLNIKQDYIYNVLSNKAKTALGYSFSEKELTIQEFENKIKKRNKWMQKNQTN